MADVAQRRSSTYRRHQTLLLFDEFGFEVMPCTRCTAEGIRCLWVDDSVSKTKKCRACFAAGVPCNGTGQPLSAAARIIMEKRRLEREERETELALEEAFARLRRLRRQKEELVRKGVRMVAEGVRDLDELDAKDRRNAEIERAREAEVLALADAEVSGAVIDWSALDALDPSLLVLPGQSPGSAAGTLPTASGTSLSAG